MSIRFETGCSVIRTDGLHGQVVRADPQSETMRVRWSDNSETCHYQADGAALTSRLPGIDMQELQT
jgi:hypothetical protein